MRSARRMVLPGRLAGGFVLSTTVGRLLTPDATVAGLPPFVAVIIPGARAGLIRDDAPTPGL